MSLGTAALFAAVPLARAESPADFFMKEAKRLERQVRRQPAPVQLPSPPQPQHTLYQDPGTHYATIKAFDRVICTRLCDGARMVMAIRPSDRDHENYRQMCRAAGHGEAVEMTVEQLAPINVALLASSGPLMDGRASSTTSTASCDGGKKRLSVPIFADTTLRRGDVVALEGGLKVFVGSGSPPHDAEDFKPLRKKDMGKNMRDLKVADIDGM